MNKLLWTLLLPVVLAVSQVARAEEWVTGGASMDWASGTGCGKAVCFLINQRAIGTPFTPNCYRQQVMVTTISNVPSSVSSFLEYSKIAKGSILWFGIKDVSFDAAKKTAVVRTFLVQDHGGPSNNCIGYAVGTEVTVGLF